ncbi:hypothetical protein Echvi_0378 [Echinicola vietnamensis DSM 17526]|uniref:Uncharacterized protein n=1 Tax=Echinicola vietnamensis (strain DSM 17526 / LMG 23754 / KMM 6221) TaxID=926556 RepID=L0FTP4_ECHVK|nr:hypothetical protein Echvi_0378 [Echinicola vietnamensis DSM 17526]
MFKQLPYFLDGTGFGLIEGFGVVLPLLPSLLGGGVAGFGFCLAIIISI